MFYFLVMRSCMLGDIIYTAVFLPESEMQLAGSHLPNCWLSYIFTMWHPDTTGALDINPQPISLCRHMNY